MTIPLGRAAYCPDCDAVFALFADVEDVRTPSRCACGSRHWVALTRWLDRTPT